jgi:hypothetical protein
MVTIKRMDRVAELLARAPLDPDCDSYRLGGEPFFLKFCKAVLEHQDSTMVPGHYLPLGFWKRPAVDPRVRGSKGVVKIKLIEPIAKLCWRGELLGFEG